MLKETLIAMVIGGALAVSPFRDSLPVRILIMITGG